MVLLSSAAAVRITLVRGRHELDVANMHCVVACLSEVLRDDGGQVGVNQYPHSLGVEGSSGSCAAEAAHSSAASTSSRSTYG